MKKAIFLDRDGTINEDVGYFCGMDRFRLIPGALDALKCLQKDFDLFIVTNQSGVARKIFSEDDLVAFNQEVEALLRKNDITIQKTYYCPHLPEDGCYCHKPSEYFLLKAAKEYPVDLSRSFVIGDHPHDIEMGKRVGARTIYLLTGHGMRHRQELTARPHCIADDIRHAAAWITSGKWKIK